MSANTPTPQLLLHTVLFLSRSFFRVFWAFILNVEIYKNVVEMDKAQTHLCIKNL